MMRRIDNAFKKMSTRAVTALGICLVFVLGIVDYLTGYELSLSAFYLIPVLLTAWYAGRRQAMLLAALSAGVWLLADFTAGHEYTQVFFVFWDMIMHLGLLVAVAYFMTENRMLLDHESAMARTDSLTGAANRRAFLDALDTELKRVARYERPMGIAYLDLDNFKQVNDAQGHDVGDRLLRTVVVTMRARIRSTDLIGRLGGDEFAVLMPETAEQEAKEVIDDVRSRLLDAMRAENWPTTFSIGVLTCYGVSCAAEELISSADRLMYEAKQAGKNGVRHEVLRGRDRDARSSRGQGGDRHA